MHGIQNAKRGCASDTYNFVFGIKLDRIRNNGNRSMLARLWTLMNPVSAGFVALTDPNLPGVSVKFWDFGTLQYGSNNPTVVNAGLELQIPLGCIVVKEDINGLFEMESVIDLLARLVAKIITGLEPKKAELLKQIAKDKAKHKAENTDFRIRIEELPVYDNDFYETFLIIL
ncbi:hypothetical protein RhiirA4_474234 [Rhizophagus irregularis]|uniref:Uncharacterized protein n=1 Tax=Rhizophagus irregularis TaxID=588596 RepID=A0A2I1H835_9GLOM|nr:hypothetical protein RhiirA4_474234 [Rhizophagus irregularis]